QMVTRDHSELIDQLRQFAPDAGNDLSSQDSSNGHNRDYQELDRQFSRLTQMPLSAVWLQIQRRIVQQDLDSTMRELDDCEGRQFDAAYLGYEIVNHQHLI